MSHKIPQESGQDEENSDYVIKRISAVIQNAIETGNNRIFLHTNLKRGLPLENINKIADPLVEAWTMEQFENSTTDLQNKYEIIHAQTDKRLDFFDIIVPFKHKHNGIQYLSVNVDVKATSEDIRTSGKSPNITSYARIRPEYLNDPDCLFVILSLEHRVYVEHGTSIGMTNGVMEVVAYSVYDLKYVAAEDIRYTPALGTGQLQIRDIH